MRGIPIGLSPFPHIKITTFNDVTQGGREEEAIRIDQKEVLPCGVLITRVPAERACKGERDSSELVGLLKKLL